MYITGGQGFRIRRAAPHETKAVLASIETFALENEMNHVRIGSADPIEESVTKILRGSRMVQPRK